MLERILDAVQRIRRITEAWIEFGLLSVNLIVGIPVMLIVGTVLLLLPFITLAFGWHSGGVVAVYVTVVMIGTAIYCIRRYYNEEDSSSPITGARIDSEARAQARSRSRIRTSHSRNRKS